MAAAQPPAGADNVWNPSETLVLVEAVRKHGRGVVLDFTRIGKEVRQAVGLLATKKRDSDFFGSRKCETKWRELVQAEDAKKGGGATSGAVRVQRKTGDPTPSDRAAEMLERLKEDRKAEILAHLATVKAELVEVEKDLASIDSAPQTTLEKWAKEAMAHPDLHLMDPKSVLGRAAATQLFVSKSEAAAGASVAAPKPAPSVPTPAAAAPAPSPVAAAPPTAVVKDEKGAPPARKAPAAAAPPAATAPAVPQKAATPAVAPAPAAATPTAGAAPTPSAAIESGSPASSVAEDLPIAVVKKRNEQFAKIWKLMNSHEKAEPFKKPVTKREAPDYHTVIKKPMALNDVKKRVDKNDYEGSFKDFFSDMNLIFSNAMQYNTKNSEIWSWAKELQAILKREETTITGASASEATVAEAAPTPAPAAPKSSGRGGAVKKGGEAADVAEEPKAKRARGRGGAEEEEEEEVVETKAEAKGARSRRQSAGQSGTRKRRREDD